MAKTVTEQLNDIVMQSVGSTALTAEALGKFVELQKQFEGIQEALRIERGYKEQYQRESDKLKSQLEQVTKENNALRQKMVEADAAIQQSKMDSFKMDFFLKRGDEMRSIISDIHRNIHFHKTVNGMTAVSGLTSANPNYYPTDQDRGRVLPTSSSETETAG